MVKQTCIKNSPHGSPAAPPAARPDSHECISFTLQNKLRLQKDQEDDSSSSSSDEENSQKNQVNTNKNFAISERNLLGIGANARVFQAHDLANNRPCAAKKIDTQTFTIQNNGHHQSEQQLSQNLKFYSLIQNEVQIMQEVSSINTDYFVKLYEHITSPKKAEQTLYMELCAQGTLEQHYQKLNPTQSIYVFQQVVQATKLLKDHRIIHRDLKLANIYFKDQRIKIGDFGFALKFSENQETLKSYQLGTALFECPEIVLKKQTHYTLDNDIFSLGVILHLLMTKKYPYLQNNDLRDRLRKGERVPIQNNNPLLQDLLQKMLQINPEDRISWENLMLHPMVTMTAQSQLQFSELHNILQQEAALPQNVKIIMQKQYAQILKTNNINLGAGPNMYQTQQISALFRPLTAEEKRLLAKKNTNTNNTNTNTKNTNTNNIHNTYTHFNKNSNIIISASLQKNQKIQNFRNQKILSLQQEKMREFQRQNDVSNIIYSHRQLSKLN